MIFDQMCLNKQFLIEFRPVPKKSIEFETLFDQMAFDEMVFDQMVFDQKVTFETSSVVAICSPSMLKCSSIERKQNKKHF
jgi:hypothetical protein